MPLRCLLFSSHEQMVQPIWQVLADLKIEGEYCASAVDAVEKVTTQTFQIVITDWDDQPEAAFLLKTARDLKAAQRPLTLAIVSDDARLPEALKAGANSVLVKPIRTEQVRDTMSTACELLRAKQQTTPQATAPPAAREASETAMAAAAAASAGSAPVAPPTSVPLSTPLSAPPSTPLSVTQAPERTFRAGEFLQSPNSAPGEQFDTESEIQKSLDHAAAAEVDALTELEPMAAAVQDAPPEPAPPPAVQEPLTGWAALQARLTRAAPQPVEASPKNELLSYEDTRSYGGSTSGSSTELGSPAGEVKAPVNSEPQPESGPEAALFDYMSGAEEHAEPAGHPGSKRGKIVLAVIVAACAVLVAVPRTRQALRVLGRSAVRAGGAWLNPPPAALPQAVAQHDSFGQSGDEYKLPNPGNIPDATTDPSQIRVLPVIDPTAKPDKSAANGGQAQETAVEASPTDQNQSPQSQGAPTQSGQAPTGENQTDPVKDPAPANGGTAPGFAVVASPDPAASAPAAPTNLPVTQAELPQTRPATPPAQVSAPPHTVSAASNPGIPSSLKSQIASSTPEASGAMPPEAAMSSIEPVNLPEAAVRDLLTQPVDPEYPAAAKASGQGGSVVLQVLIGHDGAVQDAKFMQGSLVFARAAIDAVKQWHFKPYSMNGRAVSVQSVITLSFKPPA
jgi:protein TonB